MANSSSINLTYTQEPNFEQAIKHSIAELWQQRDEGYITSSGKKKLFWCKLTHPSHTKSVMVVNGRIESCWKYQELFYDLYQQGYDVYSYDHQGQGMSERLVKDSDIGHVNEFDDYVQDMAQMVKHFQFSASKPCFLLAHSMGGTIATRYLQTHPEHPFKKVALSAPMYGVNVEWYLEPIAPVLSQILTAIYPKPTYAPGQQAYFPKPFEDNPLSQSQVRYEWFRKLYEDSPKLKVGGASTQWVWQGLIAAKQCILLTRQIKIPLLLVQAGGDRIVSNQAQVRFIKKLAKTNPHCLFESVEGAQHEVLFEKDQYRNQSLDAIFHFFDKEEKN
ncbi:alpha/beta fold hydrolase [Vibrio sp. T187]|uniref:alpha/beta fold hydrolase n=1 Tax=Vibrio TaxID=662 RepID=UPI0010CA1A59|nr:MULTISPECIES: alpha/beta fold hydrolase [Vibrio]MBW3698555.1 alpha/beta fold hydrolase [Vibrio sp. T187]